jgi:hypothetical protein
VDIGVDGERHKVVEAVHNVAQEIEAQEAGIGRRKWKKKNKRRGAALKDKEKKLGFFFVFLL